MRIEGLHSLSASREQVWRALNDPAVLTRATPGLKALAPRGEDVYDATIELAVGPVKGAYQGTARITDKAPPEKMTIVVEGSGRPGTIKATGALTLEAQGHGTVIRYVGDVQVTGVLMSVGHRLFGGVAKQLATQFFKAVEREVASRAAGWRDVSAAGRRMIPAAFTYHRPRTVQAALKLLATYGPDAKVLAGGQSLLPMMKLRVVEPAHIVDIGRIAALRRIRVRGGWLRLGALVTHWMIESSAAVRRAAPVLAETAAAIGDVQVRNLGTIGGALAHADPAADYPAAVLALDAQIALAGPDGARTVPAAQFFQGIMTTAAAPGELITEVGIPVRPDRAGSSYQKMANPASGFAICGVAAVVGLDEAGRCAHVRVGITGVASAPYRAFGVEAALAGAEPSADRLAEAAAAAADGVEANEDLHASAEYRLHLARVLTRRALVAAVERAGSGRRTGR